MDSLLRKGALCDCQGTRFALQSAAKQVRSWRLWRSGRELMGRQPIDYLASPLRGLPTVAKLAPALPAPDWQRVALCQLGPLRGPSRYWLPRQARKARPDGFAVQRARPGLAFAGKLQLGAGASARPGRYLGWPSLWEPTVGIERREAAPLRGLGLCPAAR